MLGFIIGMVIGACFGAIVMGILAMGREVGQDDR